MRRSSAATLDRPAHAQPIPRDIAPMMAVLSSGLPADQDDYSFEFKWDGMRAILVWDGSTLRMHSRNHNDVTRRYPELHALADALGDRRVVLDGEIVALDENDQPSFPLLQRRMHANVGRSLHHLVLQVPVYYVIFDVLYANGRSVMDRPWTQRREILEDLTLAGPSWRISPAMIGEGSAMLQTAQRHRLEGLVAKRLDSIYEPGRRSPAWKKIKLVMRQEFVIGGWSSEEGSPRGLGSIHVGYFEPGGSKKFRYAGAVGTGFKAADLASMSAQLAKLSSTKNPFADPLPRKDIHFVQPKIVTEIEYRRWPAGGHLQQASYKGTRTDKRASQVVREDPLCSL